MKKLRWTQRLAIQQGIDEGKTNAQIAREIGVHRATVGREIARNAKNRENYRAHDADLASWERQKEAMPKRFIITFNGVEFLSTLKKRNKIYTYISRTHLNALSHYSSEISPLRVKNYELRIDTGGTNYFGLNHCGFSIANCGFGENGISKFSESSAARLSHEFLFTEPEFLNGENYFQTFSSVMHTNGLHKKYTFSPELSEQKFFLSTRQLFESSRAFFIPKSLKEKIEFTAPDCFSISIQKIPAAA